MVGRVKTAIRIFNVLKLDLFILYKMFRYSEQTYLPKYL